MAEMTETLLNKKLESGWNRKDEVDNFAEDKELTVTITLAEYRRLVTVDATADMKIRAAEDDKYTRNSENAQLKKRIEELESFIKMFGSNDKKDEEGEQE